MDRYLVISADGHAGPPADLYREYLEPRYHERFDAHQAEYLAMRQAAGYGAEEFKKQWEAETGDGGLTGAYDSDVRNEMLDREGVAAEVLFPDADVLGTGRVASSPFGSGLGNSGDTDPELVLAGAKAHNRWLADFCAKQPDRRIGVAVVPIMHDIDAAVEEIGAVHELGLGGVMIPTRWIERARLPRPSLRAGVVDDRRARAGAAHALGVGPRRLRARPGHMAIYATEAYWWAARPLWVLLWSGVFERHPSLRYVIAENGAWWLPDIVAKMDEK